MCFLFTCFRVWVQKLFLSSRPLLEKVMGSGLRVSVTARKAMGIELKLSFWTQTQFLNSNSKTGVQDPLFYTFHHVCKMLPVISAECMKI